MKGQAPVNLILMGNALKFKQKDDIFRIYDLKGSRVAREVETKKSKSTTTLKDINFFKNQNIE
jgi:Phosphatidylinositol-4-phosphate 5-Kinase